MGRPNASFIRLRLATTCCRISLVARLRGQGLPVARPAEAAARPQTGSNLQTDVRGESGGLGDAPPTASSEPSKPSVDSPESSRSSRPSRAPE